MWPDPILPLGEGREGHWELFGWSANVGRSRMCLISQNTRAEVETKGVLSLTLRNSMTYRAPW